MAGSKPTLDHGSWSELFTGIVTDATQLFRHEVELAKIEIHNDVRNVKGVLTGIAIGAIFAVLGLGLLCVALALALVTYTTLPQWVCFGLVGGVMLATGIGFIAAFNRSKRKFDLIPQRAVEAVKEDIGWITSTVKTSHAISHTANKLERR
ncbi:MAG: phage holin family protein [Candidatus Binatia bacterium]